ncbi:MAG: hypothetical protein AAB223_03080 [Pseudomonadota bacterium]
MPKKILILACLLLLGGCAVPIPLQIASWAVDGLLFITTEKTMADHGVSLIAQRDCAMLRVVTEGALCRESDPPTAVTVAMLSPSIEGNGAVHDAMDSADGVIMTSAGNDVAERLATFETAAGEEAGSVLRDSNWQVARGEEVPSEEAALAAARWQAIIDAPSFFDHPMEPIGLESLPESTPELKPELTAEQAVEPTPGLGFDTLEAVRDAFDGLIGDDRLYLGDTGHEPYLSGADAITLLGGAGDDVLIGGIGGDLGPPPIRENARYPGRESHARRRRPPGRAGAGGRDPPGGGRARRRRVHDPQGPRHRAQRERCV